MTLHRFPTERTRRPAFGRAVRVDPARLRRHKAKRLACGGYAAFVLLMATSVGLTFTNAPDGSAEAAALLGLVALIFTVTAICRTIDWRE